MSLLLNIGPALEELSTVLEAEGVAIDRKVVAQIQTDLEAGSDPDEPKFYTLHLSEGLKVSGYVEDHEPETVWIGFLGEFRRYRPIERVAEAWYVTYRARLDAAWAEYQAQLGARNEPPDTGSRQSP